MYLKSCRKTLHIFGRKHIAQADQHQADKMLENAGLKRFTLIIDVSNTPD